MTLRKLAFLGTALAGAALLRDKTRRDSLMRSASDFINNAKQRLGEYIPQARAAADAPVADTGFRDFGAPYTPQPGSTGGNGIY